MSRSPGPAAADAADAADAFVTQVRAHAPSRVEVRVESRNGMPLLCAVEAVLSRALPRPGTIHELIWLTGAPRAGGHVLSLQAFGRDNQTLAKAVVALED